MFQDHDGTVQIGDLMLERAEFLKYEPEYSILPGVVTHTYRPGVCHTLSDGDNIVGGPMPWDEGDNYIGKEDTYRALHEAAQEAPVPTDLEKFRELLPTTQEYMMALHEDRQGDSTRLTAVTTQIDDAIRAYPDEVGELGKGETGNG